MLFRAKVSDCNLMFGLKSSKILAVIRVRHATRKDVRGMFCGIYNYVVITLNYFYIYMCTVMINSDIFKSLDTTYTKDDIRLYIYQCKYFIFVNSLVYVPTHYIILG